MSAFTKMFIFPRKRLFSEVEHCVLLGLVFGLLRASQWRGCPLSVFLLIFGFAHFLNFAFFDF